MKLPQINEMITPCRSNYTSNYKNLNVMRINPRRLLEKPFLVGVAIHFVLFLFAQVADGNHHLHHHKAGDQYLMRPRPSKGFLTVTKLQEPPGSKYDPRPEDMDVRQLRIKMGKNFDPEVMSIRKPHDLAHNPNGTVRFPFKRNKKGRLVPTGESGQIPKSIKKLQYGSLALPDGTKVRTRLSPKLRRKLVQFLWAYTSCPVYEKWRDLGSRFWPRWLKEGHCYSERSCSIPPGMSCKPSEAEYKILLRWHCQDYDKAKKCRWIPIRHPIVTACACECPNKSGNGDEYDDNDFE